MAPIATHPYDILFLIPQHVTDDLATFLEFNTICSSQSPRFYESLYNGATPGLKTFAIALDLAAKEMDRNG